MFRLRFLLLRGRLECLFSCRVVMEGDLQVSAFLILLDDLLRIIFTVYNYTKT
jgi:hypothetical protein